MGLRSSDEQVPGYSWEDHLATILARAYVAWRDSRTLENARALDAAEEAYRKERAKR